MKILINVCFFVMRAYVRIGTIECLDSVGAFHFPCVASTGSFSFFSVVVPFPSKITPHSSLDTIIGIAWIKDDTALIASAYTFFKTRNIITRKQTKIPGISLG